MYPQDQVYSVIIIGGGPAGLSTALHLAKEYPEISKNLLVLEKESYPRHKLCAGGLVSDAELILSRLGLDTGEVPHVDADEVHMDFEGRGLRLRLKGRRALRIIRRDEFDAWLANKAQERGIQICQAANVRAVRTNEEGASVESDSGVYRAQVVVGADGSNGITRRGLLPDSGVSTARLLEIISPEQGTEPASAPLHGKTAAYFDFFIVPKGIAGYTWDFPTQINGSPRRCWGIYDTNLLAHMQRPALRQPLADEMQRHGLKLENYELKGHPIRWFNPKQVLSGRRVILAGDAAGSDPLFGEGISIALGYGLLAAAEVGKAFEANDFSFQYYKNRVLKSSLGRTLLLRWAIANIIYSLRWRWFQFLLWRILKPAVLGVGLLFVVNWGRRLKA